MRRSFSQSTGRNQRAFSLVELMVVVVTAAVFTLIAAPMWMSRQQRDLAVEAQALLEAMYAAERVWYAENDEYLEITAGTVGNNQDDTPPGLGLECQGNIYFSAGCFSVVEDETYGFIATCNGSGAATRPPTVSPISIRRRRPIASPMSISDTRPTPTRATGNTAPKASRVSSIRCEMRGTNEFRLSTDSGRTWSNWE